MAFESNFVSMVGNLTEDPELRFTQGGVPVCTCRIAWNRRYTGRDGQEQEETVFINASLWRDYAENVAESLRKGDRVVVLGRIKTRSYDNAQGQTVWVTEIDADEVAPSLRWARAEVSKVSGGSGSRDGSGGGGGGDFGTPPPPGDDDVPF